jgi:hypothetical protein
MTPLNSAATIGVSLAPSADLLKSLFAPSGSVTQRGKRMRVEAGPLSGRSRVRFAERSRRLESADVRRQVLVTPPARLIGSSMHE